MKLSVITVNLNNRDGLLKTIKSVRAQSSGDFEWIVIDGGSTDGSRELIQQNADEITYWVSEPDKGIYNAMNKGVDVAKGEYVLFLNSGDYFVDSDVLGKALPLLDGCDVYVGQVCLSANMQFSSAPRAFTPENLMRRMIFAGIPHQATFFRRRVFGIYGKYREDKQVSSDWWWLYRAVVLNNATIAGLPLVVAVYDTTGISSVRKDLGLQEREELLMEYPQAHELHKFYRDNFDIVKALTGYRWVFFIFRVYFYIYRKWMNLTGNK